MHGVSVGKEVEDDNDEKVGVGGGVKCEIFYVCLQLYII